jgi:hypothetical protein
VKDEVTPRILSQFPSCPQCTGLGINKFLSGDLQLANEMFQVKGLQRTRTRTRAP